MHTHVSHAWLLLVGGVLGVLHRASILYIVSIHRSILPYNCHTRRQHTTLRAQRTACRDEFNRKSYKGIGFIDMRSIDTDHVYFPKQTKHIMHTLFTLYPAPAAQSFFFATRLKTRLDFRTELLKMEHCRAERDLPYHSLSVANLLRNSVRAHVVSVSIDGVGWRVRTGTILS